MTNLILQVVLIIVPAAAVILMAYFFLKKSGEKELRAAHIELKRERQKFFLPSRAEAYQRSVLLMERIHPNSLVMRMQNPGLPAMAMQVKLLDAIREEYEHNIAQQLFVSPAAWELVKQSKEETLKIIHLAGKQMEPTSMALDLSSKIFEIVGEVGKLPSEIATEVLKKELQELF
ncbi:MAG: hypothetical protein P8M19_04650 [Crocinitomicaceae bacterium]|nr:hypothetical protein [Crocinitomicaceae bacterium]MDG1659742.1 hypothetical protein [Crocinitomicaceae bacterium]MDG2440940.1 hypothetical protein [Crocinitomicaceae bacterium]|tara:strand:- start:2894 stop:3418 length:525 start_codon:yes stop_codon:yes gene_type:complete